MKYCANSPAYSETVQAKASACGDSPGRLSFYSLHESRKKVSHVTLLFVMLKNYSRRFAWSRSFQFLGITLFSTYAPQGSLTISLGHPQPDKLPFTLSDAMGRILMDEPLRPGEGILHHPEGVDLMPADIQLSGMEVSLVNAMSRETILRQYLDTLKGQYSHILIDCQPSLGMLTVNALAAANRVIIPVQAEYLPAKGLEQLLQTVNKVKRQINPKLQIDGILLTMVDNRTNFAKEIAALLRETYGSKIKVFGTEIPHSVRAKEISAEGKSIFAHDPNGKVAEGYKNLTKEVIKLEKQREKSRAGSIR